MFLPPLQVLSSVDELCSCLPVFPNLKLLDFGRLDLRLPVIIKLLHNAPHLETLQLSEGIEFYFKKRSSLVVFRRGNA